MSRLAPFAYWLTATAMVAGVTHLVAVLALPTRAGDDAYSRLARIARGAPMTTFAGPPPSGPLPDQDPALASAFCLVDLREGPVQVELDVTGTAFAALSIYGRTGRVLYGLTNRSATRNRLALTILTHGQASAQPKADVEPALARVRVEADESAGIVVAQVLATAPSGMAEATAQAARLSCAADPVQPAAAAATPPAAANAVAR